MVDTREGRLSEAFIALADTLVTGYDVVDLLHTLADGCVDLLDAAAAGLVLRDAHGGLDVLASTSEQSELLELLQLRAGEGPCVEAYAAGIPVDVEDTAVDGRWPAFRAAAVEQGFRSVHAVPMRLREQTIGALNLFRTEPGLLPAADQGAAQALADVATIGILHERALRHSELVNDQLQGALNSRVLIEQAKGVLAEQGSLDMDQAFTALRRHARTHNRPLRDVAAAVIAGTLDHRALATHPG